MAGLEFMAKSWCWVVEVMVEVRVEVEVELEVGVTRYA